MNLNDLLESLRTENPCWKGYHPVGTKKKNGRTVPNCVPGRADEDVSEGTSDRHWFNNYEAWKKAAGSLEKDDDGPDYAKLGGRLVAHWQDNRGWIDRSSQGVAEGFPYDVDHMPGPVIRNADMTTDNVKTKDKAHWDRAVNSINAKVFDDMAEFRTDRHGESVTGNSAVWAKWDNATQTGWFNAKGRPLKPWPVKEQDVAEGVNVDSQIKRIKDRILQLKDWNTAGTHDKKIKELQAKLKDLQSQKQSVAEVSDKTLINYLTKVDADARKHQMDPTKRDPKKASRSVGGFNRAFNKLDARKGVDEDVNTGPQIIYATGPRKMGINDVDLVFKDVKTGRTVAYVVGNNWHPGDEKLQEFAPPGGDGGGGGSGPRRSAEYHIFTSRGGAPTYIALGDPEQDTKHKVYKISGNEKALVSNLDWWSFLEKMFGEIMWEDDAIDAGLVNRLDNGDLVFTKPEVTESSERDLVFYAKLPTGQKIYARTTGDQLADLEHKYGPGKVFSFARPDVQKWLEQRGVNLRKFVPGIVQRHA